MRRGQPLNTDADASATLSSHRPRSTRNVAIPVLVVLAMLGAAHFASENGQWLDTRSRASPVAVATWVEPGVLARRVTARKAGSPSSGAAYLAANHVHAIEQEMRQAARQLEAAGNVTAEAAMTIARLAMNGAGAAASSDRSPLPSGSVPATGKVQLPQLPAEEPPVARAYTLPVAASPPPPPSDSVHPPVEQLGGSGAEKACAPGCELRGVCNRELGRCDCPPLTAGAACEVSAVPLCRELWGFRLPAPPCQAWTTEEDDWRDFPPTCECLAECHVLNHRVAYVGNCVNISQLPMSRTDWGGHLEAGATRSRYPFLDPYSDGRWIRQAFTPHPKNGPQRSEDELRALNRNLAERLTADGRESRRLGLCSGRGLYTAVLPWKRVPGHLLRKLRKGGGSEGSVQACHCFPGWFGDNCELGPASAGAPEPKRYCVQNCSDRGVCLLNWCHCVAGTWGIDCSMGSPDPTHPLLLATANGSASARPDSEAFLSGGGWTEAMLRAAPPPLRHATGVGPRIYVYDLPPQFNIWLAAHFRVPGRWDQSYLYSLDAKMHRWLLRSPYRTLDPKEADFFFIPSYLSQGFYDYEFGLYWLAPRGVSFLRAVLAYVRAAWPFFNKTRGSDHILVMTNDKGATFIRGSVRDLAKVTLVTQWGWKRPHIHHPELDIVVPPMLKVDKLIRSSPFRDGQPINELQPSSYKYLLSFVGSVRFHTPGYSMGVRQKIFRK